MPDKAPLVAGLALVGRLLLLGKYPVPATRTSHAPVQSAPSPPKISRSGWLKLSAVIILTALATISAYLYNEMRLDADQRRAAIALTSGDPAAAPRLIIRHGCAGCHIIPGVPEAAGQIGPPLNNLARQAYVGGVVENTIENLVNWIVDPHSIDPLSAMPRTGISAAEAHDVAAYLLSLRS
jgi:cytochrome c